jgi:hypothetical protein
LRIWHEYQASKATRQDCRPAVTVAITFRRDSAESGFTFRPSTRPNITRARNDGFRSVSSVRRF